MMVLLHNMGRLSELYAFKGYFRQLCWLHCAWSLLAYIIASLRIACLHALSAYLPAPGGTTSSNHLLLLASRGAWGLS